MDLHRGLSKTSFGSIEYDLVPFLIASNITISQKTLEEISIIAGSPF